MLYVLARYAPYGPLAGCQHKETSTSKKYNHTIWPRASQFPWAILVTASVTELPYLYFKNSCQQCALLPASLKGEGNYSLTQTHNALDWRSQSVTVRELQFCSSGTQGRNGWFRIGNCNPLLSSLPNNFSTAGPRKGTQDRVPPGKRGCHLWHSGEHKKGHLVLGRATHHGHTMRLGHESGSA